VTNGNIRVGETRIDSLNDAQRRDFRIQNIGFVFQDFELLDYLNVIDNILHPFRITRALKLDKDVRERAAALAEKMGIGDKLKRQTNDLSHGEKQRNAISRALLPHPKLILADEATGNLDPENKDRILDLLFQAVDEHEATLLAVTHDYELLKKFDRIVDFRNFQSKEAV
jgi:putative ABC transport system ATP-binding protein